MMVHLSIMPVSDEAHLSESVAMAVKIIDDSGLEYQLNAMGTLIKGDWKEVMQVVKKCHDAILDTTDRVVTQIKIDDDKSVDRTFSDKVKSVENKAGVTLQKQGEAGTDR